VTVTVVAPAKLTVSFKLLGTRADGYHLVDGELVALSHADVLTIDPDGDGLVVTGPAAAGVPADATNLVARALALVGRHAGVHIDKRIRPEGGLGGGSSDAAAVLRWAGCTDPAVAARLGADVAFCLRGGRARVSGVGEIVDPLPFEDRTYTLVTPPFGVSTVAAYRAWDALGGPVVDGPNDLEPAAFAVEPRLAIWRDRIREVAGTTPVLAGSGSTFFVTGAHPELGPALPDATVVVTRTVPAH
jgi:4-diphosphocytidyl-2-C-methyl-D-erythritol kinase